MLPPSASTPEALTWLAGGVGDVVAALQACGAVSLLSPVPGQLATLCAGLNVGGHGITAPPASDLLAHRYQRRKTGTASERHGCAAAPVMLPDLDGIRLAILGLHNDPDNTAVHLHASGPMCDAIHGPAKPVINGQRLDRVRLPRHLGQRRLACRDPDADAHAGKLRRTRRPAPSAASARSATSLTASCSRSRRLHHRRDPPQ